MSEELPGLPGDYEVELLRGPVKLPGLYATAGAHAAASALTGAASSATRKCCPPCATRP